jgi:hypothetical protein
MYPPSPDETPELDQQRFESFFDEEQLNEPLCEADADEVGEALINVQHDVRYLFSRALRQYRGTTWISNELWKAYQELDAVYERLLVVYNHNGFKPPPQ